MEVIKILHIASESLTLKKKITGIKSILLEEIKYINKCSRVDAKLYGISKKLEENSDLCINNVSLDKDIINYNPTFVIFHGFYIFKHVLIAKFLKKNNIKYYIKPHGGFNKAAQEKAYFKKKIARILYFDKFVKNSSGIIYLNEYEKSKSIYHKKFEIILPNGLSKKHTEIKPQIFTNKYIKFIYFGRIEIQAKGLDILLESIVANKDYFFKNNIIFKFYGNGRKKDINYLKRIVKNNSNVIKYYGPVYDNKQKYSILQENDINILLSKYEGMPMSILEGLSVGLPCFISEETGLQELIEACKCGWIKSRDRDIFYDLQLCIKDYIEKKTQYRLNALKVSKKFIWEKLIYKYYENYLHISIKGDKL